MGRKSYVEGLSKFEMTLVSIGNDLWNASEPHHLHYPISRLIEVLGKIQKFRDDWYKSKAKIPLGRYAAQSRRRKNGLQAMRYPDSGWGFR